jgi:anti-sigma factor RsiW
MGSGACRQARALLSAWIDGELQAAEAEFVAAHVGGCQTCTQESDDLAAVRALLRSLPARHLPPEPAQAALSASNQRRLAAGAVALTAAGLLAGIVLGPGDDPAPAHEPAQPPPEVFVVDHFTRALVNGQGATGADGTP